MTVTEKIEMMTFTIKQLFFSRRTFALLLLSFFPLVIIVAWMYESNETSSVDLFSGIFIATFLQFIILIISLLHGTSIINSEIANKTINYLSTRHLLREEIYLYRYLGSIPLTFFIIAIPLFICQVTLDLYTGDFLVLKYLPESLMIVLLGVACYNSIFAFIAITIKRPLMIGLLFAFFWEILLANLPGSFPYITLMFYLRSMSYHMVSAPWPHQIDAMSSLASAAVILGLTSIFLFMGIIIFRRKDLIEY